MSIERPKIPDERLFKLIRNADINIKAIYGNRGNVNYCFKFLNQKAITTRINEGLYLNLVAHPWYEFVVKDEKDPSNRKFTLVCSEDINSKYLRDVEGRSYDINSIKISGLHPYMALLGLDIKIDLRFALNLLLNRRIPIREERSNRGLNILHLIPRIKKDGKRLVGVFWTGFYIHDNPIFEKFINSLRKLNLIRNDVPLEVRILFRSLEIKDYKITIYDLDKAERRVIRGKEEVNGWYLNNISDISFVRSLQEEPVDPIRVYTV
ncbi:MAG: hypothetical protein ARM1_0641 [Candidatus Micrarchaeota archaeon]|nr:MAG: hypothetical protein ARM1_0641 [Candidatus Micrarchaeota archaeon]